YNYRELRDQLEASGWSFRTSTDSEVLLKSYLHWGQECLHRFNGMFAFLIWDEKEQKLFGARDRFGEKPLFYAETPRHLFFASEIKALIPLLGRVPPFHPGVVREYLQEGNLDYSRDTFFRGVYSIPAAHSLTVRDGRLAPRCYWQLQEKEEFQGDPIEAFRELFLDSIRLRTRSDVPLGTCLSGGLDSGAIVCGLSHELGRVGAQVTRKTF